MNQAPVHPPSQTRILSVDFFRGLTLFILLSGIAEVFVELNKAGIGGSVVSAISRQTAHGEWFELYFWDLIQPFFMFIVGVAMPFSITKRLARGDEWAMIRKHALIRSFWLLVLGFMLGAKKDAYFLTNILPQLAITYPIAFVLMRIKIKWQLVISFACIIVSDLLYYNWPVEGYNLLLPDKNFGTWVDVHTTGHIHPYHWVTFNAVPTLAHVIWGIVAGKLLMSNWPERKKFWTIMIPGIAGVLAGYALRPYLPIIERIASGTYVIVTGGFALISMALSFYLVDILQFRKIPWFFAIFGMNPIFLYLFGELGGGRIFHRMATPFTSRLFGWGGETMVNIITIILVAGMFWYLSYFLYRKKIFFKL